MSPIALSALRLLAVIVPLLGLAYFRRIYPHRPMVYLALLPGLLSLGLILFPSGLRPLLVVDAVVVLVALVDLFSLPAQSAFRVQRETGRIASLRTPHPVRLEIANLTQRTYFVSLRDGLDGGLEAEPGELAQTIEGRSAWQTEYRLHVHRRGAFTLQHVHVCVRSRFGLWKRYFDYPSESVIHVYPDMGQLSRYAVLARADRLNLLGVRRSRRVGQDNEFERLRDYTPDDNYKFIDWRSTARRGKLTVKDFQQNQSQRLIFLIDCGRMMTNQAAGYSLLDHALNSMLMLSYVALMRGDSVGLLCFSDEIHQYVPPRGGREQMNRMLHASFDRFPRLVESRYDQAFLYLSAHCQKRCLVILISNVIDEVNRNQVQQYMRALAARHLPLAVLLRDRGLFEALDVVAPQGRALYQAAAAAEIATWRNQVLADLRCSGVLTLDVFPEGLTAPLVNRYLDIKARHLL